MSSFIRKICFIKAYTEKREADRQPERQTERQRQRNRERERVRERERESKQPSPAMKSRRGCMFFILHLSIHEMNDNVTWLAAFF